MCKQVGPSCKSYACTSSFLSACVRVPTNAKRGLLFFEFLPKEKTIGALKARERKRTFCQTLGLKPLREERGGKKGERERRRRPPCKERGGPSVDFPSRGGVA